MWCKIMQLPQRARCLCRGDKFHNPHTQKRHDGMEDRNDDVDFDEIGDDEHMRDVGIWE